LNPRWRLSLPSTPLTFAQQKKCAQKNVK
jgi:hypothetical protein